MGGARLSKFEPDRNNLALASPRQYSFSKIAAIFFGVGAPIFCLILGLAMSVRANGDPIHTKISEAFGGIFSFYGLLGSYAVGLVPSLIIGLAYSKSYRHRAVGSRLLIATLTGAIFYFVVLLLVLCAAYIQHARIDIDGLLIGAYATGAGAVSAFLCALILEMI
jgi:hypothetical protein